MIFALTLPAMIGIGALAVDGGYLFVAKTALQGAVDAAALAGASGLSKGTKTARARASKIGKKNLVLKQPVPAGALTYEFGTYDLETGQFTVSAVNVNGMRVTGRMTPRPCTGSSSADVTRRQKLSPIRSKYRDT